MAFQIEDTATLGRMVRRVRTAMGLTQPDLAMTAGVGLRFIVEVEKGKPTAQASAFAVSRGFKNVYQFAGDVGDWEAAGYPIEESD